MHGRLFLLPFLLCLSFSRRVLSAQAPVFLNAGFHGPDYIDADGNVWVSDAGYYNTGNGYSTTSAITNTDKPAIYQTERYDLNDGQTMTYSIPVMNGDYDVSLHYAEIYTGAFRDGARKFDVFIEGAMVQQNFDIFQEAGAEQAVIVETAVTVSDDVLTIDFIRVKQSPKINAIEIRPVITAPVTMPTVGIIAPPPTPPLPTLGIKELILVDAVTNQDIKGSFNCFQNSCLGSATLFNVRASTIGNVGSVRLTCEGPISKTQMENVAPYALFGDSGGNYNGVVFLPGAYTITVQAFSEPLGQGEASEPFSISFSTLTDPPTPPITADPTPAPTPAPVTTTTKATTTVTTTTTKATTTEARTTEETTTETEKTEETTSDTATPLPATPAPVPSLGVDDLILVDSDTNQEINGGLSCVPSPCLGSAVNFNIRANTFGSVGSVRLTIDGPIKGTRIENMAPFAVFGDESGNYAGLPFPPGTYTVTAQAYSEPLAQGRESAIFTMAFAIFPELDDDIGDCPPGEGKCLKCQGDCDTDADCGPGLYCFKRDDDTAIPGCSGLGTYGDDYCYDPAAPAILTYIDECTPDSPCGFCEGDCDSNSGCEPGLACFQRDDYEPIPGCGGTGFRGYDYCYNPTFPLSLVIAAKCTMQSPCRECQGGCTTDADCLGDLVCFSRTGNEPVPSCVTGGLGDIENTNYCHEKPSDGPVTYIPGDLSFTQNRLVLSTGLTSRVIARSGRTVAYDTGGASSIPFHSLPDGGGVFPTDGGGWIYTSNSEDYSNRIWNRGGVGAIRFNSLGEVVDYEMVSVQTSVNCGGGKTWWNTWLTCEERSGGHVYEVDPRGVETERQTLLGADGDNGGYFESAAYYRPNPNNATFYVTEDSEDGALRRFTPDVEALRIANELNDFSQLLHSNPNGTAKIEYLKLSPETSAHGSFTWTTDKAAARFDVIEHYSYSEGIDIAKGRLYMTAKSPKVLMILDLETGLYERQSTESGAFDGQPDQIRRIIGDTAQDGIVYFCEDEGWSNGVHGRDVAGNFYTILEGPGLGETTGLDFSPDKKAMYISFQQAGRIYEIKREDGYPFGGTRLDIKYHNA